LFTNPAASQDKAAVVSSNVEILAGMLVVTSLVSPDEFGQFRYDLERNDQLAKQKGTRIRNRVLYFCASACTTVP
jgi:hypothetical protein